MSQNITTNFYLKCITCLNKIYFFNFLLKSAGNSSNVNSTSASNHFGDRFFGDFESSQIAVYGTAVRNIFFNLLIPFIITNVICTRLKPKKRPTVLELKKSKFILQNLKFSKNEILGKQYLAKYSRYPPNCYVLLFLSHFRKNTGYQLRGNNCVENSKIITFGKNKLEYESYCMI